MSENKGKTTWFGALVNLFRPEPDMVSLEEEAVHLRAELARREREAIGRIAVYEDDLAALAQGIRVIQERCGELETVLNRIARERSVSPSPEGGSLGSMVAEEDGW